MLCAWVLVWMNLNRLEYHGGGAYMEFIVRVDVDVEWSSNVG